MNERRSHKRLSACERYGKSPVEIIKKRVEGAIVKYELEAAPLNKTRKEDCKNLRTINEGELTLRGLQQSILHYLAKMKTGIFLIIPTGYSRLRDEVRAVIRESQSDLFMTTARVFEEQLRTRTVDSSRSEGPISPVLIRRAETWQDRKLYEVVEDRDSLEEQQRKLAKNLENLSIHAGSGRFLRRELVEIAQGKLPDHHTSVNFARTSRVARNESESVESSLPSLSNSFNG